MSKYDLRDYMLRRKKSDALKIIEKNPEIVNEPLDDDLTPFLYSVIHYRDIEIIKALIEAGADASIPDKEGVNALLRAVRISERQLEDVRFKLSKGEEAEIDVVAREETILMLLATLKNIAETKDIAHVLSCAAACGYTEVVNKIVAAGVGVDTTGFDDKTPLYTAALHGRLATVKYLLDAGADVNQHDMRDGFTPLHCAVLSNCREIVDIIINAGGRVDARDESNTTPLHLAKSLEIANKLICQDADVNAVDVWNNIPLHNAVYLSYQEVANILVKNGSNTDAVNKHRKTPLDMASQKDRKIFNEIFNQAKYARSEVAQQELAAIIGSRILADRAQGKKKSEEKVPIAPTSEPKPQTPSGEIKTLPSEIWKMISDDYLNR